MGNSRLKILPGKPPLPKIGTTGGTLSRLAALTLVLFTIFPTVRSNGEDLRGFGHIQESELPNDEGIRFECDSEAHAVLLIHKLARDMAASVTTTSQWVNVVVAGRPAPVLVRPGLGAFLVLAKGTTAYCFSASLSAGQSFSSLTFPAAGLLINGAILYDPVYTYPMYLDKWSSTGIGSWYPYPWVDKWTQGLSNTVDDHFTFAQKYNLTVQPNDGRAVLENLLPKIHEYARPYHFAQWMDWSPSLAILDPEDLFVCSPHFSYASNYYGQVSFGSQKLEQYRNWDWVRSVKQFVTDPNLVDWLDPNGEIAAAGWLANWDNSENNRANFVRWLRQVKGYSLAKLGKAWYGDTKRFDSWDQVPISRNYDFYGYQKDDTLANQSWRVHTGTLEAGLKLGYPAEKFADSNWVEFQMPGGEIPAIEWHANVSTWYRGSINVSADWLTSQANRGRIYLNAATLSTSHGWYSPDRLWINGQQMAALSTMPGGEIVGQVDVTGVLHPGTNSIVYLPCSPVDGMPGVFFLSTSPLESYPFSDPHLNARYADWEEYCEWAPVPRVEATLQAIRDMDSNRPIKVHGTENQDHYIPLMAKYGAYPHNTGNGGYLRPWDKRDAYVWGIPASAELGGAFEGDPDALRRFFGFFSFEGINAFDQFHNIQDMMAYHPVLSDLWAEYLPYLHLANRYDLKKPDIAIFFSKRMIALKASPSPYVFDLGRGDLQSIGYSYVYIDESSLAAGLAQNYPVIWDTGTSILNQSTVEDLKKYVENGGTYIAIQDTGRHTTTQRNAWPISALTGFRVREIRPMTGTVMILNDQPLFSKLAGKIFYNRGLSQDYSDYNFADKCVVLEQAAPDTQVLARYQDGSIAMGLHNLGKGRVITLGSPFWRDSHDNLGFWHPGVRQSDFLEDLLAGLALKPLCESDNRMIWREHYLANNGTEEYLVLWNQSEQPQMANLGWHTLHPATALYDAKNGRQFPATTTGDTTAITNLSFKPYETLILATQSQRAPQKCVSDWFSHLALWWHPSAPGIAATRPDMPLYEIEVHDTVSGANLSPADYARVDLADLSRGMPSTVNWRNGFRFVQPQNTGVSVEPEGHIVYRCPIELPSSWSSGDRYFLKFIPTEAMDNHTILIYLNGQRLPDTVVGRGFVPRIEIGSALAFGKLNLLILGTTASGYQGRLIVERQPRPLDSIAVTGPFKVQASEDSGLTPVNLPGSFTGLFAFKNDIDIPSSWKGSRVFIRITTGNLSQYSGFAINDKVVFHPLDANEKRVTYMDITPWVKPGHPNRIILLPITATQSWQPGQLDIQDIKLERN